MPKTKKPIILILLVLLLLAAGLYWQRQNESASPGNELVLSGSIEARQVRPGFLVAGRIGRLAVNEGSAVKAGQVLAELEASDYQLAVEQAQARRDAAAAALAALEAGSRPQEIAAAKAALAEAQARLALAKKEVGRLRDLVPRKLASQEKLDQAVSEQRVAQAASNRAKAQLELLQAGPRKEDIDRARAELAAAESALKTARQRLAYTRLEAPLAGVVSTRLAEAGDVVGVGVPVFEIDDMAHPWVRGYLNEPDLPKVKLGQAVTVHGDGLAGSGIEGRLAFISPRAEFTPKTVETHALRVDLVYRVKIDVPNPDGVLKMGMPVDVVLPISKQ